MSSDNNGELLSTWTFKDGKEYLLSLRIKDAPKSLDILISDKITAEEWSAQFDSKHIETLTQRTGNYKTFDTFISMIKYAILKKSESVLLDLMSYEDLKGIRNMLKTRQSQYSNLLQHSNEEGSVEETSSRTEINESGPGSKKYFIVTYVSEFDTAHYPLPLLNSAPPNTAKMQKSIKKLMMEISQLRSNNAELQEAFKLMQIREGNLDAEKEEEDLKKTSSKVLELAKASGKGMEGGIYYRKLFELVGKLEQQIICEREEHSEAMHNLQTENTFLRRKFEEFDGSGRKEMRKKNLDENNNVFRTRNPSEKYRRRGSNSFHIELRESDRPERSRSKRMKSFGELNDRNVWAFKCASRTRTPSPGSRFDPTAYVKEKKMKENFIKKRIERRRRKEINGSIASAPSRPSSLESVNRKKLTTEKGQMPMPKVPTKFKGSVDLIYTKRNREFSPRPSRKLHEPTTSFTSDDPPRIRPKKENEEEMKRRGRDRTPRSLMRNNVVKNEKKGKLRSRSASLSSLRQDSEDKEGTQEFIAIDRIKKSSMNHQNQIEKEEQRNLGIKEEMVVTFGDLEERIKSLDNLFERKFRSSSLLLKKEETSPGESRSET